MRFGGGMRDHFGFCNAARLGPMHIRVAFALGMGVWGSAGVSRVFRVFRGLCGRYAGEISGKWLTKVGKTAF